MKKMLYDLMASITKRARSIIAVIVITIIVAAAAYGVLSGAIDLSGLVQ
jgi:hypothetical protein